ncbi:hypothetical protein B0A55_08403, partial [Friedmanniomyces simplex]
GIFSDRYHILKPGEWPFDFYQALLDFAEQEADRDVAYPYIDAQFRLRRTRGGPNGDKKRTEGFLTVDVVEALTEWRRDKAAERVTSAAR